MTRNRIFKYILPLNPVFTIEIPIGAEFLCLQLQNSEPCLWLKVNQDKHLERVQFYWIMTGEEFNEELVGKYRGTLQFNDGKLILHLFEYLGRKS